jgi:putative phosphoribosyl transferase
VLPVFDIPLSADRLNDAVDWANETPGSSITSFGLFSMSAGAAPALVAAAKLGDRIKAVVSRSERPDPADQALAIVTAPTLPIAGGRDHDIIELNQKALGRLKWLVSIQLIPGATHLFEEPSAMDKITILAQDWFERYLSFASV